MDDDLEAHTCGQCGIRWAAPKAWWKARRESRQAFFCPNGHQRIFSESEADKLRRERDRLKQSMAYTEDRLAELQASEQRAWRQATAFKGVATRIKNRVGRGVCPCCSKTFSDLERHMEAQHKDFIAEEIVPEGATVQ